MYIGLSLILDWRERSLTLRYMGYHRKLRFEIPYPTCQSSQSSPWLSGNALAWGSKGCRFIPSLFNRYIVYRNGLCYQCRAVLISGLFRHRNNSFHSDIFSADIGITDVDVRCRILPKLRSMSMPTYVKLWVKTPYISMIQFPHGSVSGFCWTHSKR